MSTDIEILGHQLSTEVDNRIENVNDLGEAIDGCLKLVNDETTPKIVVDRNKHQYEFPLGVGLRYYDATISVNTDKIQEKDTLDTDIAALGYIKDLSNYYTKLQVNDLLLNKQDIADRIEGRILNTLDDDKHYPSAKSVFMTVDDAATDLEAEIDTKQDKITVTDALQLTGSQLKVLFDGVTITLEDNKLKANLPSVMTLKGIVESVGQLPSNPSNGDTYFVKPTGATESTLYTWIENSSQWVSIGSTDIDLSAYAEKNYVDTQDTALQNNINLKQDKSSLDTDVSALGFIKSVDFSDYYKKGEVDTLLDGKQETLVNQTNIKSINGESLLGSGNITISGSTSIIEITYVDLKSLRDGKKLQPGQLYRITDYVTTTSQADTQSANHPFDLIVLATSTSTLSEEAKAIQHEGDTYFVNSNLNAWKVMYCLDNDTNRFTWADTTNGKGVIWHLIDERNNSLWYDFKNIQTIKTIEGYTQTIWYTFDNNGVDSSLTNNSVYSNVFGNYVSSNKLQLPQNIFIGNIFYSNTIGNNFYNNIIGYYFYRNTIGDFSHNNTIGNNFNNSIIGNGFYSNTLSGASGYNIIGNYFINNTIGNNFNYNAIGNEVNNNTIGTQFNHNTIGNYFSHNKIGNKNTPIWWDGNTFGDNVSYVDFGGTTKNGVMIPSFYRGTASTHKTLTPTSNTTYYLNQQQLS